MDMNVDDDALDEADAPALATGGSVFLAAMSSCD